MPPTMTVASARSFAVSVRGAVVATMVAGLSVALGSGLNLFAGAGADPATGPGAVSQPSAGALTAGTIPPGTCRAHVSALGGGGGSSGITGVDIGGVGGPGADLDATFAVVPGQSYSGSAGGAGGRPFGGTGNGSVGRGGVGGIVVDSHRGGGGGGRSTVNLGGTTVLIAGGGGGGGAAHGAAPAGNGGAAGVTGIGPGTVATGSPGTDGIDGPGLGTPGAGQGGQVATGGSGGVHSAVAAQDGLPGSGVGVGNGGQGGSDPNIDSGGGGGGGYTGGGGGAATLATEVTGAGGGGGSSWVAAGSPVAGAPTPTGVAAALGGPSPPTGFGPSGSVAIDFAPCLYDLTVDTAVSPATVRAGDVATWTVTVTNNGPDPMTQGDTIDLTSTLPAGPNGGPGPDNEITSFVVSGGTDAGLDRGPLTCTGVTVGAAMPAATTCSRAYAAPGAAESPSGGLRGLDPGESLEITYEQVISNTAPCATITNTVEVQDRPSESGTTDVQGVIETSMDSESLVIDCYDLGITKTADPSPYVRPDGTLSWTVTVTNGSAVDMEGPADTTPNPLVVTDVFPTGVVGAATLASEVGPAGPCTLAGSTTTCTAGLLAGESQVLVYEQVVAPDAAADTEIANTAGVVDPALGDEDDAASASVLVAVPSITLDKTADPITVIAAGDTVAYSFLVTNTGNVTLTDVAVADPLPDLGAIVCPVTVLAPLESTTCTASYTVTQDDMDAGSVLNTATASGLPPVGDPVEASDAETVNATSLPAITLDKTADPTTVTAAGDAVEYSFLVTNTGNVTLTDVAVTDPLPDLGAIVCPVTVLAPLESTTCTASYTVTQADMDAGSVLNTATASGQPPVGDPVEASDAETVATTSLPALTVGKTASPATVAAVGDVIDYTITATNTGNVTVSDVVITDPTADAGSLVCTPATPVTLAPAETATCTATHTVVQADLDEGAVTNIASASGIDPSEGTVAAVSEPVVVPVVQTARLSLVKQGELTDENGDGFAQVSETIVFSFEVTNTGNVTLSDVAITDPLVAVSGTPLATLAPGATDTTTFSATYSITQADLDAGRVVNQATATGTDPSSATVSDLSDDASGAAGAGDPTVLALVVAPSGPTTELPRTGEELGLLALGGVGLVGVGVSLVLLTVARRRSILGAHLG